MEVLPCSGVQHARESDCSPEDSGTILLYDGKPNNCLENDKQLQIERQGEVQERVDDLPTSEHLSGDSSDYDDINAHNDFMESYLESENSHLIVNTDESELHNNSAEGDTSIPEPVWLEGDESVALWVKWRGKWQVGIRCAREDWPLSTLKAKPTHDKKKYYVIFFPHTRNYSWADMLLVRSINDLPQPIAYKSHEAGLKMVKDLTAARRFVMKKLAVGMLNSIEQFHTEALIESARDVIFWKEFATEVSRCHNYRDLGRMLLKLQNMILQRFINSDWIQHSLCSWVQRCQNAQTAEAIGTLKEELFDSISWNEVNTLRDAAAQPTLGFDWKTWKLEVLKWFSTSHSISNGDVQQQRSDTPVPTSLQVSRKRPKLEVRRAESHAQQIESKGSDQAITLEIDSEFFKTRDCLNAAVLASECCKTETDSSSVNVANKWNETVVEAGNPELIQTKDVDLIPVNEVGGAEFLDSGNKNQQCIAFIESKGRQCVRWANEGDDYCCVHVSSRFMANSAKKESSLSLETPMCQGTTVLGTKCKHRSLFGSSFCKKHGPRSETKTASNFPENMLKRKHVDSFSSLEPNSCKELMLVGDSECPLQKDPVLVMEGDIFHERNGFIEKNEHPEKDLHCIDFYLHNNSNQCMESPKRHSLYCDKHLPSWLKRARNGKSRIVSKEVFMDLLRDCSTQDQKIHLHHACELFYRLFKSIISLRNPVPKEVQFQWALTEASKDFKVGEFFTMLVFREKERLKSIWGFHADEEDPRPSSSLREEPLSLQVDTSHANEMGIKCKICSEEFPDDQALSDHWMESHKKEAQWLFRGYACSLCLDSFTNKKVLETHVQERHHVQFVDHCMLLQCIACGSHFGNSEQLWLHVLSVHPIDLRLSKITHLPHNFAAGGDSQGKVEQRAPASLENNSENLGGLRRFICRFCGLKFDLLPDLGRHHQAAHMGPGLVNSRPSKKGIRYYAYKLKSGRLSRPRLKRGLAAASLRIRNRANASVKRRIQASKLISIGEINGQGNVNEEASFSRLAESQCSSVANILLSEIQKTKPRPNNLDVLSIARSACCRISLKASLEEKYGMLPEHLYLKAAKLCSENNIQVSWHLDGFICPKGCKMFKDPLSISPLRPRPVDFVGCRSSRILDSGNDDWRVDECHYIIDSQFLGKGFLKKGITLCSDISFGQELVPVVCVADDSLGSSDGENSRNSMPWESFTYVTKPLLDQFIGLNTESMQLGCACPKLTCCPETCDHVYLFDNDYDDAKDIFGKPMRGRFPYDKNGRIILEEGYLAYECHHMCSCNATCPNRVLQKGVQVKLEVFKTEKKGWAVRAGQPILRGTFVCEYTGEVLDEQEANNRRERYGNEGCLYFYDVDAHNNDMSRLIEGTSKYVIDATRYGNVSRFINHSCSPNLVNYQVLVESMDCERAHIGLYANRDIITGEELTFDYHYNILSGEGYPCHCGASTCRGRLY